MRGAPHACGGAARRSLRVIKTRRGAARQRKSMRRGGPWRRGTMLAERFPGRSAHPDGRRAT
jgi:hypothetical protein